jgi:hypothetical protein
MKLMLFISISFFSVFTASAEVYKCINNATAKIDYQAQPCPTGYSNVEVDLTSGKETDLDEASAKKSFEEKQRLATLEQLEREKQEIERKQALLRQAAKAETEKNQQLIKENPDRYSAFAIPPYLPDNLPELVKPYENRLPDIERFRRVASEEALDSEQCGRVEAAELNQRTTANSLVFLIDCSTGAKFYFSEYELNELIKKHPAQ